MRDHDQIALPDFKEYPPSDMQSRADAFHANIRRRHTVRAFSDRSVDREVIRSCIQAAGTAPSGANHQPWFFAAISDPAIKHRVREAAEAEERAFYGANGAGAKDAGVTVERARAGAVGKAGRDWLDALSPLGTDENKPYLETAPWLIAIFAQRRGGADPQDDRKNYYVAESVGIATGFLIAALHHAGLATLTHTPQPMSFLNDIAGRPDTERPYILLVAGYPAEGATVPVHAMRKKPLAAICTFLEA